MFLIRASADELRNGFRLFPKCLRHVPAAARAESSFDGCIVEAARLGAEGLNAGSVNGLILAKDQRGQEQIVGSRY